MTKSAITNSIDFPYDEHFVARVMLAVLAHAAPWCQPRVRDGSDYADIVVTVGEGIYQRLGRPDTNTLRIECVGLTPRLLPFVHFALGEQGPLDAGHETWWHVETHPKRGLCLFRALIKRALNRVVYRHMSWTGWHSAIKDSAPAVHKVREYLAERVDFVRMYVPWVDIDHTIISADDICAAEKITMAKKERYEYHVYALGSSSHQSPTRFFRPLPFRPVQERLLLHVRDTDRRNELHRHRVSIAGLLDLALELYDPTPILTSLVDPGYDDFVQSLQELHAMDNW